MTLSADRSAIESRLSTNWSVTDIAWDNVDYTPTNGVAWISCTIVIGEEQLFTTDSQRQIGIIMISIFTPISSGSDTAMGYADTLAGIFRKQEFSGIMTRNPTFTRVGESAGWYQLNVAIPYWRIT